VDIDRLVRYAAGRCSSAERAHIDRWLGDDAERHALVAALASLLAHPGALVEELDVREGAARLQRAMGATGVLPIAGRIRADAARERRWTKLLPIAAAVIAAAGALLAGGRSLWLARTSQRQATAVLEWHQLATAAGERRELRFADGSRIVLGPDGRLRYGLTPENAGTSDRPRVVELDGSAFFSIVHDTAQPFLVRAAGVVTEDLGTVFTVRTGGSDSAVQVIVAEGSVAVRASRNHATPPTVLGAGKRGRIRRDGAAAIDAVDAWRQVAWIEGTLTFDDAPLTEVAQELARWFGIDVRLSTPALAGRPFTGTLHATTIDATFDALAPPMHVRYEHRGRTVVLMPLPDHR
jgi:transmembrane sensor